MWELIRDGQERVHGLSSGKSPQRGRDDGWHFSRVTTTLTFGVLGED